MKRGLPPNKVPDELFNYNQGNDPKVLEARRLERERQERIAAENERRRLEEERRRQQEEEAERDAQQARDRQFNEIRKLRREVKEGMSVGNCAAFGFALNFGGLFVIFVLAGVFGDHGDRSIFSLAGEFICGSIGFGFLTIPTVILVGQLIRYVWLKVLDERLKRPFVEIEETEERKQFLEGGPDWDALMGYGVLVVVIGNIIGLILSDGQRWYHFIIYPFIAAMIGALLFGGIWACYAYARMRWWNANRPASQHLSWSDFKDASGLF